MVQQKGLRNLWALFARDYWTSYLWYGSAKRAHKLVSPFCLRLLNIIPSIWLCKKGSEVCEPFLLGPTEHHNLNNVLQKGSQVCEPFLLKSIEQFTYTIVPQKGHISLWALSAQDHLTLYLYYSLIKRTHKHQSHIVFRNSCNLVLKDRLTNLLTLYVLNHWIASLNTQWQTFKPFSAWFVLNIKLEIMWLNVQHIQSCNTDNHLTLILLFYKAWKSPLLHLQCQTFRRQTACIIRIMLLFKSMSVCKSNVILRS